MAEHKASTDDLTKEGLKYFGAFRDKTELVQAYVEAATNFTHDELKEYTETFIKYDQNKSGDLDAFELNKMYEARGETKTVGEMNQLIKTLGDEFQSAVKRDGVTFKTYLSVILKDKKGTSKTSWGSFAAVAKKHDTTKSSGKLANIFEQKAAEQLSEQRRIEADVQMRKTQKKLADEEAARKAKTKEALAKFTAGINH